MNRNQRKWYKHFSKKTGTPNKNISWTLCKLPVWEQGQKEAKTHRNRWQFPVLVHLHALAKWKKSIRSLIVFFCCFFGESVLISFYSVFFWLPQHLFSYIFNMKQPARYWLELPVLCIYQRFWYSSIINARYWYIQYCVYTILDFRYCVYTNTGNTSVVKQTILEAPVFFIQQYW
jgi:hypothetical protein